MDEKEIVETTQELRVLDLLSRIIEKSYLVSNHTDHDVFLDFSGHVNFLTVQVYKGGWRQYKCEYGHEHVSKPQFQERIKELNPTKNENVEIELEYILRYLHTTWLTGETDGKETSENS